MRSTKRGVRRVAGRRQVKTARAGRPPPFIVVTTYAVLPERLMPMASAYASSAGSRRVSVTGSMIRSNSAPHVEPQLDRLDVVDDDGHALAAILPQQALAVLDDARVDAAADRDGTEQPPALADEQLRAEWARAAAARRDQRRHGDASLVHAQVLDLVEEIACFSFRRCHRARQATGAGFRSRRGRSARPGPFPVPAVGVRRRHAVSEKVR